MAKGFTLVESLIYVAIAATSMLAISAVFISGLQTKSVITGQQLLLDSERIAELQILSRLEEASQVLTPASAGTEISLTIDSPTGADNPVLFSVQNETLMMTLGAQTPVALTPERVRVTGFSVERLNGTPPTITMTIATAADTGGGRTLIHESILTYTLRYD